MKYLKENKGLVDADSGEDAVTSSKLLEQQLFEFERQIQMLPPGYDPLERAELEIRIGSILIDLGRGEEAFEIAREAFDRFVSIEAWEGAVQACDVMYRADNEQSLVALGQGVWLAVTFPIDPELTVAMLEHIVDETPPDSDGAAVAATVAHYIADVRAAGKKREELTLFTNNLLATVARRHSDVTKQEEFSYWFEKLELNDPDKFLPRLRNIIDVLVQEDWWVDRESIWAKLASN